ncbi:uncharacterized protein C5orf49 homolog isoform X2 [Exaiptasia diaphana]|uniref:Uncharacterized protein n=1 Tax=Exaiptasia diaphana TaxID=2652724 RepID=A0A913YIA4_EXADI|nr:uncharacterized protein C5orf49 homolog isoform X2 [Exaiptasia diaphana]
MSERQGYNGPGNMSIYGLKRFTIEQSKEQWRESIRRECRGTNTHTITSSKNENLKKAWKVDINPYFTGEKELERISFYNTGKQSKAPSVYDRTFHIEEGYYSKLKRDDRQTRLALNVYDEEKNKTVPTLSSSQYGRRPPLEAPSRRYVRVSTVKRDFYRESGANITGNT